MWTWRRSRRTEPPGRGPSRRAGATGPSGPEEGRARRPGAAASYTFRQARRASRAEGAGDSGLYRLIELHAFNAAGDAAVAISLAGTLFFAQPGEARGQVALFLGLTMLPFAVVAPLLGPFLDRFSHGRRWAIGATMATAGVPVLADGRRGGDPVDRDVPDGARRPGLAPRRTAWPARRPCPACCRPGSPWSRPTAGSPSPASSAPRSPPRWPRSPRPSASQWVAALRLHRLRRRDHPLDPAARPRPTPRPASCRCSLSGDKQKFRVPAERGLRAALQRGPADAVGLPDDVHGLPAAPVPAPRLGGPRHPADGPGHRRRRAGQHDRHRPRVGAATVTPSVTVVVALLADAAAAVVARGLLRADPGGRPRPHRRRRAGDGQGLARRHHPARRARAAPHLGLRPLRDAAPALLGDRRRSSASRSR